VDQEIVTDPSPATTLMEAGALTTVFLLSITTTLEPPPPPQDSNDSRMMLHTSAFSVRTVLVIIQP
jgi:hypothetical protein